MFDPAIAERLVAFFRQALAREARRRHDTAAEMLAALEGDLRAGAEDSAG